MNNSQVENSITYSIKVYLILIVRFTTIGLKSGNSTVACTNKRLVEEQKPVSSVEIKGFIGLMLLLGATKKHDLEISEVYKFGSVHHTDWATVCMSKERFHLISAKITFDDLA